MPRGGLEPPWANAHQVLNLARLPVPPPRPRTENGSLGLGDEKSRSAPDSTLHLGHMSASGIGAFVDPLLDQLDLRRLQATERAQWHLVSGVHR